MKIIILNYFIVSKRNEIVSWNYVQRKRHNPCSIGRTAYLGIMVTPERHAAAMIYSNKSIRNIRGHASERALPEMCVENELEETK